MIDLHLVSWNRPKMTELVIKTIHRNTKPGSYSLHVLDNGSDEQTIDMLDKLRIQGLMQSLDLRGENKGLEWARHELFNQETSGSYFVDIDNDCLPPSIENGKDWIEQLVGLMEANPDYAAISCRTQVMIGTGNIFEDEAKDITDFPHPGGSLRIMRTKAVQDVGGWDRQAPGRGSEERYICGKLRDAGWKTGFATHIPTLHLFGTRYKGHETDRWGYDQAMKPEETGHSDIWHPALSTGDEPSEVYKYAGVELTQEYFNVDSSSKT